MVGGSSPRVSPPSSQRQLPRASACVALSVVVDRGSWPAAPAGRGDGLSKLASPATVQRWHLDRASRGARRGSRRGRDPPEGTRVRFCAELAFYRIGTTVPCGRAWLGVR